MQIDHYLHGVCIFRAYADYYEVIKNPIGLLRIGSNIKVYAFFISNHSVVCIRNNISSS